MSQLEIFIVKNQIKMNILDKLAKSKFRSRFKLRAKELEYIKEKGLDTIYSHACDFIRDRVAPAEPVNDGKQTPMRGHLVFIAQHATATCCRGCIEKWHKFPKRQRTIKIRTRISCFCNYGMDKSPN